MFDKIKIERMDESTICLEWNDESVMIMCIRYVMMITSDLFELVGIPGQQDQVIGDNNGVFFRKIKSNNTKKIKVILHNVRYI